MTQASGILRATIDDYLLGLAEGIVQAERRLGEATLREGGRPIAYTIPKVDFELRMLLEMIESAAAGYEYTGYNPGGRILLRPPEAGTASARTELVSTIKGTFVAVPANAGKPAPVLRLDAKADAGGFTFSVRATSPAGEALAAIPIELSIDVEQSRALSQADAITLPAATPPLGSGTFLEKGALATDASGTATTRLAFDSALPAGTSVMVVADAPGVTASLVVKKA